VATAVPLLLFASGTRRINLTVIGMIQFITPIMQFVIGVVFLHEPMPTERWIGFIIVWIAVAVFVVDMLLTARRHRRAAVAELV
jgi:chloramphenicol-sensitive protein RarD